LPEYEPMAYSIPGFAYHSTVIIIEIRKGSVEVNLITTVFFDLDGTLTDPAEGIKRCIVHALERMGRTVPAGSINESLIGPPLRAGLAQLLGQSDPEIIEEAVKLFRERYGTIGILENRVYPGIADMLDTLHKDGLQLFIVTTKLTAYAERIAAHFLPDHRFSGIYGAGPDGSFDDKAELIEHVLERHSLVPGKTVMIGDRARDVIAGRTNGLKTIGVTYGYGSRREFDEPAPDAVCDRPQEIVSAVTDWMSGL